MKTVIDDKRIVTMDQVRQFLERTNEIELVIEVKAERYQWIERTFKTFEYTGRARTRKPMKL